MSKVFIVYASAGAGHQKAAEALFDYLKRESPSLEIRLLDILDYSHPLVKRLYSDGYIFLISKLPWVWYFFYRLSSYLGNHPVISLSNYRNSGAVCGLLRKERPDVGISTHFLSSSIIRVFKRRALSPKPRLVAIITDYTLHPFWIGEGVDLYITSCAYVKEQLEKRGIESERIKAYGIPAKDTFYVPAQRNEIAQKHKIAPKEFTVLVITGAIGIGPIEHIVKALAGKAQVLVVCGRNKRLYERISMMRLPLVKPFPLINYVDELMSVSDVVLTKAGGLTITESLAKRLPMVFFSSIPGLETANERTLKRYGAGFRAGGVPEIVRTVLSLKNNPELYKATVENIQRVRNVTTLKDIAGELSVIAGKDCDSRTDEAISA